MIVLMMILALASCASTSCASTPAGPVTSGPGGDGGRTRVERFRLGWYDRIGHVGIPATLAGLGFDTVLPYASNAPPAMASAFLGAAEAAGMQVIMEIPRRAALEPEGATFTAYVEALRSSPALESWYLYDEPEWKPAAGVRRLEASYAALTALDPGRDVTLVFMFPFAAGAYRGAMDRMGFDWYPVVRGSREFAAFRGGRYADRMRAIGTRARGLGKELLLVLQGFGEDENGKFQFGRRLPTAAEARYMFYAALLARPATVLYWAYYRSDPAWVGSAIAPIVAEFRERFPGGITYAEAEGFTTGDEKADLMILGNDEGREWLLVLGREDHPRELSITLPAAYARDNGGRITTSLEVWGARLVELPTIP